MATLATMYLLFLLIGKKRNKRIKYPLLGIALLATIMAISGRIENLYTAPTKLIEKQEQVTMLEEQLETLISNFRYVPSEGNTIEELYAYLDEYETLNSRLKALNDELSRHQRQCNPHSLGNRLIDFTFDFGITKKFFSS